MLVLNNISVSFGEKRVLHNYSCRFPEKGIVVISGPSGCGKTTLLRVISGLQKPDGGEISGVPSKVAYVFQEHRLIPWLSAVDNVTSVLDKPNSEIAFGMLSSLGIDREGALQKPSKLSGGMRQRVSIARALCYGADLYLLDEPFNGLDEDNRINAMKLLKEKAEKTLIIIVTHNVDEIDSADMFIRMEN